MYAYHLCEVNYTLRSDNVEVKRGKGSVWMSQDSILIKTDNRWLYLPEKQISKAKMIRDNLRILLDNDSSLELKSKNVYILNALYHYIEGAICRTE